MPLTLGAACLLPAGFAGVAFVCAVTFGALGGLQIQTRAVAYTGLIMLDLSLTGCTNRILLRDRNAG